MLFLLLHKYLVYCNHHDHRDNPRWFTSGIFSSGRNIGSFTHVVTFGPLVSSRFCREMRECLSKELAHAELEQIKTFNSIDIF